MLHVLTRFDEPTQSIYKASYAFQALEPPVNISPVNGSAQSAHSSRPRSTFACFHAREVGSSIRQPPTREPRGQGFGEGSGESK